MTGASIRDSEGFLAKVARYVRTDGGRNLNKISHELSIPYQTLRFRMLNLKDQGITVLPMVDTEKIGLDRIRVSLALSPDVTNPKPLFGGLHQKAGLTYYSMSLFTKSYDCEFVIPCGTESELRRLFKSLEEMQLISRVSLRKILWKEVLMMKTQFYDYEQKQWSVDFSRLSGDPSSVVEDMIIDPSKEKEIDKMRQRVDLVDLLIIKELQIDPWIKIITLSRKLDISDRNLAYHLNKHVLGRKFVPGFRLKWIGAKNAWLKHGIVPMKLIFTGLSENSLRFAMSIVTALPFTWNHMKADDQYITELIVPVAHMPETMIYISENLHRLGLDEPTILFVDWLRSSTFTVPYLMFEKSVGWKFDAEESLGYVLQMIKTYSKP